MATFHTTIPTSSNTVTWHLPCHYCYICRDGCVKRSHIYVVVLVYALCQPVILVCELCLPVTLCILLINYFLSCATHALAVDVSSMQRTTARPTACLPPQKIAGVYSYARNEGQKNHTQRISRLLVAILNATLTALQRYC